MKKNFMTIRCSKVSVNYEIMEFIKPKLFELYMCALYSLYPRLAKDLFNVKTQNGYELLVYLCESVEDSQELAEDRIEVDGPGEHSCEWRPGKTLKAFKIGKKWFISPPMIVSLRMEGSNYAMSYYSPDDKTIEKSVTQPPTITKLERDILLTLARSFSNMPPQLTMYGKHTFGGPGYGLKNSDNFRQLLMDYEWSPTGKVGLGGEHWTQPEMEEKVTSATLKFNHLYVFSYDADVPGGDVYDIISFYEWSHEVNAGIICPRWKGSSKIR